MKLFSVHLRDHGRRPDRDLILVKEGFSWPAFLFTFLWALSQRLWWAALAFFAAVVLAGWGAAKIGLGEDAGGLVTLAVSLAIGMIANDILRWSLTRAGFQEVGLVTGKNADEATRRFLDDAEVARDGIYP